MPACKRIGAQGIYSALVILGPFVKRLSGRPTCPTDESPLVSDEPQRAGQYLYSPEVSSLLARDPRLPEVRKKIGLPE